MNRKVVLITGAAQGIGASIALEFASNGYDVVINYNKSEEKAKKLNKEIVDKYHVNCMIFKCDLIDEDRVKDMIDEIISKFSKIDVLVNNAAIEITSDFKDKKVKDFKEVLDVNLIAPFIISRYVGDIMYQNKYGKIINIVSDNAFLKNDPSTMEYDASKAGLISLTHNLASYYAPYLNVNALAPGWIMSDKVDMLNKNLDNMLEKEESKKILLNRFGKPYEVAKLVFFLASDNASYINSEVITINGGIL